MTKLKVGFKPLKNRGGPNNFMRRLRQDFARRQDVAVTSVFNPFHDISIQSGVGRTFWGRPYVLRLDGVYMDKANTRNDSRATNRLIRSWLDKAKGCVFNAEFCRQSAKAFLGPFELPTTVIHNAVNLDAFKPDGPSYRGRFPQFDVIVIVSAEWRRHKRLEAMIKAFQHAAGPDWGLLILGQEEPQSFQDERIISLGWWPSDELPKWLRTGDLLLHLAWIEPFANSVVEAMACGLPVICANNGGMREAVEVTGFGEVVETDSPFEFDYIDLYNPPEPKSYDDIAAALHRVLSKKRAGEIAPPLDYLSIERAGDEYLAFLKEVAGTG